MTPQLCPSCADRRLTSRLLVLTASRHALSAAADQLNDRRTWSELALSSSLVDAVTVERVAGWLQRRSGLYGDALVSLGEAAGPLVEAADARVQSTAGLVALRPRAGG